MRVTGLREHLIALYVRVLLVLRGLAGRLTAEQAGQSMVEYAIVAAVIAFVVMAALQAFAGGISAVFQRLLNQMSAIG